MRGALGGYREWFRLELEHAYYGGRGFTDWRAVPTRATRLLMAGNGLLARQTAGVLVVLAPAARDVVADTRLAFSIVPGSPHFGGVTVPAVAAGQVLVADSLQAVAEPSGAWRLHRGASIDAGALQPAGAMDGPGPVASLLVRIAPHADGSAPDAGPRRYLVRLEAASTYWKYYLQGALAGRALAVVDVDQEVEFHRADGEQLGGSPAAVFLSDRPIALRERSPRRFQLCEQAAFGAKVLMKRLPVAGAAGRTRALVGDQAVLVSEIFLNF
jgi:hypothetical protein